MEYSVTYKKLQPPVDIIIPFHGQYDLLGQCVESIIKQTFGQIYSLTLVDDYSDNKDFFTDLKERKLKNTPIQFLRHDEQKGFGAALKTGFDNTQNAWVCFLHADCKIVRSDWLSELMITMQSTKKDGVKLVSAKLSNGGTGAFDANVIGNVDNRPDVIVESPLPIVCTLVNRELFSRIGGFIKPYPYFGYEDEELFWRMKIKKFKQAVSGKSFVEHAGGITAQQLMKDHKIAETVNLNKEKFKTDIVKFAKENNYK
jgi:glycosyltransferase involved in cell wall biosynthesis